MSNDSSKPARKPYGPISAIAVTFLAYFLGSQVVLALVISIYMLAAGKDINQATSYLQNATFGQFLAVTAAYAGMLATIYWFMRIRKISWKTIGLGRKPTARDLVIAFVAFVGYFIGLAVIVQLVGALIPSINVNQQQQIGFEAAKHGGAELPLVFISLVILPPLVEEILIRGFLYTGLRVRWTKYTSIIVASLLFGLAHLQLGLGAPPLYVAAIDTFFLSVVLIALRERTGSLWSGIFVHAIKNSLAFTALFIVGTS
jgi:membrane protease YdiL (CAAX protease family)